MVDMKLFVEQIQANEIKAYLYAWLGMRRMRPIYDIHPVGERPDLTFRCEVRLYMKKTHLYYLQFHEIFLI